jgi:hypothetical protein
MTPVKQIGIFYSDRPFDMKELPVMKILVKYYTPSVVRNVLIPIISNTNREKKISLRALDWLVTNYAKKHPQIRKVKPSDMPEKAESMYSEYKMWLRKYRRAHFDPFRRRNRITFILDNHTHQTTVGQLNFMYWASRHGVLDYAYKHIEEIENDHSESSRTKNRLKLPAPSSHPGKRKRRQLSEAPMDKVLIYSNPITVCFKPGGKNCQ